MRLANPKTLWFRVFLTFLTAATFIYIIGSVIKLTLVWHYMVMDERGASSMRDSYPSLVWCTAIAFTLTIILSAVMAWFLTRKFTRPLAELANAADDIASGDWKRRVSAPADIVEFNRLTHAFNKMCDANEERLQELRALTDDVAHDLKTPLTRMQSSAELAFTGKIDREELAATICETCNSMLQLIRNTLDISHASNRLSEIPRDRVDFAALVRQTVELFQPTADSGKQQLVCDANGPVIVDGHKMKLQQVIGNLIENALKFTPPGGTVAVSLQKIDRRTVFRVSDTGCGIASNDLPHIFSRFWRADTNRSRPGNGLGLALVKAIVTSYGGTVECSSEVGIGSSFVVTLPA